MKTSSAARKRVDIEAPTELKTVRIGKQVWMVENLAVDRFRNGDPIPSITTPPEGSPEWGMAGGGKTPASCVNDEVEGYLQRFGRLYNWFTVMDPRGLAPEGWHVPTAAEWNALVKALGGKGVAAAKLKSAGGWEENPGTNESGFDGAPGGVCRGGGYFDVGRAATWWTSTERNAYDATMFSLHYMVAETISERIRKADGVAVRCVRD